jgi:hypothetical protein
MLKGQLLRILIKHLFLMPLLFLMESLSMTVFALKYQGVVQEDADFVRLGCYIALYVKRI